MLCHGIHATEVVIDDLEYLKEAEEELLLNYCRFLLW